MKKVGLHNCIPTRKVIDGKKTSNSRSLCSTFNRDTNNWDCTGLDISERNRREMLANLLELRVLLMTATMCCRLGGGGYINRGEFRLRPRGSAAIAKLVMGKWDVI